MLRRPFSRQSLTRFATVGTAALASAAAAIWVGTAPALAAPGDGSAFGLQVNVTLLGGSPINVGPLAQSSTAGPPTATVASVTVPGIITTGVVTSSASHDVTTGEVTSTASVNNMGLPLLAALGAVSADKITATCDATQAGETGTVTLTNATLGSLGALAANPAPNTVIQINIAGINVATLTLNEQIPNADGSLTVNAWHLHLLGGAVGALGTGDVIIGSATCGPATLAGPATTTTTSSLSATTAVVGTSVTDTATVTTGTGEPTGTMSFTQCGPLATASGCNSSGTALGTPTTLSPSGGSASATSAAITPTQPGIYCIGAFYSGDGTHNASSDTTACVTVTPPPLAITTTLLPNGEQGVAYDTTMAASGGVPTYTWSATGLPPGLSISTAGEITGTPTASGAFTPDITVTDSATPTAASTSQVFPLTIDPLLPSSTVSALSATTAPLGTSVTDTATVTTNAKAGTPSGTVTFTHCGPLATASGCASTDPALGSPVTVSGSGGTVTATSTGLAPTQPGIYCIGAFYSGDIAHAASSDTTGCFTITTTPLAFTTTSLPNATVGSAYTAPVDVTGGVPSYTWSATGLPTGLTIDSTTGEISGTPTQDGNFTVDVTVTDSATTPGSISHSFALTVAADASTTVSKLSATTGLIGTSVTDAVTVTSSVGQPGGTVTFTQCGPLKTASGCTSSGTALGGPVTLSGTGTATSAALTPSQPGIYCIGAFYGGDATHGGSSDTTACFTITVLALKIDTTSLPNGQVGAAYDATVTASGGLAPYTWQATNLPAGLSIDAKTGVISGTPTAAGPFPVSITVTDSEDPVTATATFQITVAAAAPSSSSSSGTGGLAATGDDQQSPLVLGLLLSVGGGLLLLIARRRLPRGRRATRS